MIKKPDFAHTYVPPSGPTDPLIAIVGEQPGKSEIFHRPLPQPFVGPTGRELDKDLMAVDIPRSSCYLTNVIKDLDAPLKAYIDLSKKVPFVSEKARAYIDLLKEELNECSANVIVVTGNIPLYALCDRTGITKWRGSVLESTLLPGRKIVPTIHPATIIPPKNVYLNKHLLILDLKRAKEQAAFPEFRSKERTIKIQPSFGDVMNWLDNAYQLGMNGRIIDYDIEIYNEEVSCISVALSDVEVMSIPFVDSQGDYFTLDQEAEIWRRIALLLEERRIWKRGQNIGFDAHFLLRRLGIKSRSLHDTMVVQKTLFPDYPMGLDFICTMYTDLPYYKNEGKKWFKVGGAWRTLWNYNALDSIVCADAHPKQVEDLKRQGNLETYERQRKIIEPLVYMMERGIRVDVEEMKLKGEEYGRLIEERTAELQRLCGFDINPNSPKQLANYFYGQRGLQTYRKRGGGVTTDDNALKRLARKGVVEASLVREIREYTKAKGNYLNLDKVDKDARIRCSYNPAGTRFSRISSSENIFGTGCLMPNAEVLTPIGWIELSNLVEGLEVAQWNPDGRISWCTPVIHKFAHDGFMIKADSSIHKNMYTPNHRLPTISKRGNLTVLPAEAAAQKSNWFLPLSGRYTSGHLKTPFIRLFAMIQADGSYEGNGIRISFKKSRKIERFLMLMDEYELDYNEQKAQEGYRRFYIPVSLSKEIMLLMPNKELGPWILWLDQEDMSELLDELPYWDGLRRGRSFEYFTSLKVNAEWAATLAHLCGHSATINFVDNRQSGSYGEFTAKGLYIVNVKPRSKAYQASDMYSHEKYKGDVYCVTTDTSYFVARYNDRICITGNSNLQNWPHELLEFLLPDEGYVIYTIDLSQAENRIVAYVGNVTQLIEAFETGRDVHSLTAALILGKPVDEISSEDGSSSLGSGHYSERFWGKKANHSLDYDLGYKTFALRLELPETQAKWIVERFHTAYPGIRQNFHAMVKAQLAKNRTLTNLMGRKTLFLDEWGDKLWKVGYSCIPQGTVGDVINERGLNYVYYNQKDFAPIDLLTQTHDSITFQIPLSVPWERHAGMLRLLKAKLETPLVWNERKFVIPADISMSKNFNKDKGIKIKTINAQALKEAYNDLSKT